MGALRAGYWCIGVLVIGGRFAPGKRKENIHPLSTIDYRLSTRKGDS
jgi:hypothetical protein